MYVKLAPKLVTLNDLERRNSPYFALIRRIRYLRAAYVKVVEDRPMSGAEYRLLLIFWGKN